MVVVFCLLVTLLFVDCVGNCLYFLLAGFVYLLYFLCFGVFVDSLQLVFLCCYCLDSCLCFVAVCLVSLLRLCCWFDDF